MSSKISVLLPLAHGFEEIEAITVLDVLRRAEFEVTVAGLEPGAVTGAHGLVVQPDVTLEAVAHQTFELIVLPGGMPGATHLRDSVFLRDMLLAQRAAQRWIAAICASPVVVLEAHGLLEGVKATAYPSFVAQLPEDRRIVSAPVVIDGKTITSQAPGTAMEFALTLVECLRSNGLRVRLMEGLGCLG